MYLFMCLHCLWAVNFDPVLLSQNRQQRKYLKLIKFLLFCFASGLVLCRNSVLSHVPVFFSCLVVCHFGWISRSPGWSQVQSLVLGLLVLVLGLLRSYVSWLVLGLLVGPRSRRWSYRSLGAGLRSPFRSYVSLLVIQVLDLLVGLRSVRWSQVSLLVICLLVDLVGLDICLIFSCWSCSGIWSDHWSLV